MTMMKLCSTSMSSIEFRRAKCRDGVCVKLGNELCYPNPPVTEHEPTSRLCAPRLVCTALPT